MIHATRFFRFFKHINFHTLRQVADAIGKQRLHGLSAEMAYNAMLALFPTILAVLTAVGLVESSRTTLNQVLARLSEVAPEQVLYLIQNFIDEITLSRNQGLFSISFVAALWVSSSAISAAMAALDQIHEIPLKVRRPFWKAKLISLGLTVGTIVLFMVASFLVLISDSIVRLLVGRVMSFWESTILAAWRLLIWPASLGIVSAAFAFIYRCGPSYHPPKMPIFPGAAVAAVLWACISGAFRLYVSHFGNYNRTYGAVGAVIVLLLWLYLSSLSMLIGAQLNLTVGEAMGRSPLQTQFRGNDLEDGVEDSTRVPSERSG